ncbi:hypothetical protein BJ322DRAFT_1109379 [Thelephora terrestris]|uniref:Uncharacterized protein n=1 Tax=Thelephora terrestris TaxID=56493 RepID=A0A9P6L5U3_9AGAM|nr:hypothetical protein BJ322DRAFT_1109379 [Thelephora terrestris]
MALDWFNPLEREEFHKEHADGAYSMESFFFVYLILEVPFEITSISLLLIAVNLERTVLMYFTSTQVSFCMVNWGRLLEQARRR